MRSRAPRQINSCTTMATVAKTIDISQLNVIVSPEMHNETVKCMYPV